VQTPVRSKAKSVSFRIWSYSGRKVKALVDAVGHLKKIRKIHSLLARELEILNVEGLPFW
jgi:hypothetical protein